MRPAVDVAKELILLECYASQNPEWQTPPRSRRNDIERIKQKYSMTSTTTRKAYNGLLIDGFLYPESRTSNPQISVRGVKFVEELLLSRGTFEEVVLKNQRDLAAELTTLSASQLEEEDEEIFPSRHAIRELDKKTAAEGEEILTEAIEAIRRSNEKGQEAKAEILHDLEDGREIVKKRKISAKAATTLILAPLYATYLTFAEEGLRAIVIRAIDWLQKTLGF